MSEEGSIDAADRRLISALQEDGRMTNQDLAKRCGLSPAACHERLKRLRENGVILGFTALIDPRKLDCGLLIFVEVQLVSTSDETMREFAQHVRDIPEILECHMVAGGFDYLIKARVPHMAAYRTFLGGILASLPSIRETRTYAVLEEVKETTQLPVRMAPLARMDKKSSQPPLGLRRSPAV